MRRFVQWLPLLTLIPLWGSGLVLDRIAERALLDSVHERLVTALHAHQRHVFTILAHQQQGLRLFSVDATASLAGAPTGRKVPVLHGPFLASLMPEAIGCLLFDAKGQMVAHTEERAPSFEIHVPAGLTEARVSDPSVDADGRSFYDVILPLRSDSRQVGTLACRLKDTLSNALAEHRQGLGLTGEVYLVNAKTHLMLTESRFIPNAVGRVKVDTIGMREALKMRNGIAPYPDYRGIPVIGTFLYLRDYDWVLLAEMDEAEALAPLLRLRMAAGLSLGLISVVTGIVGWRYGRQLREAGAQTEEARDLAQKGEAQVKALLRSMADAVFEIDESSTILLANESAHRMFGWPSGELIGRNVTVLMPPEDVSRHEAGLRRYLKTGESRIIGKVVEVTGLRRDGSPFPCELSVAVVVLPDGTRRFIGVHRDVTERKQMESRNRMLAQAIRTAMDGVVLADPQSVIIETNPAFDRMFGYERGELIGQQASCLYPPAWREKEFPAIAAATRETGWTGEVLGLRKDGSTFPRWISTSPIHDPEGRQIGMLSVSRDITERAEAHQALKASEEKFRTLVETTSDWFWEVDENVVYTYASPRIRDFLGYAPEEVIGRTPFDLMPPDEARRVAGLFSPILAAREPFVLLENINLHKDGHEVVLETGGTPIFDGHGVFRGYHGTDRNITERKKTEESLRRSEERFKTIFDQVPLGIALIDSLTGHIYAVNAKFAQIAGRTVEEMTRIDWMSITHPDDVQKDLDNMALLNAGEITGFQMEKRYLLPAGDAIWIHMTIAPVKVEDKAHPRHLCMIKDITERKQAEAALQQRLEELERFQKATVQREFRIKELKEEVERLKGNQ